MTKGVTSWLYRRLRGNYPLVYTTLLLQSAFPIAIGALGLFSFYYERPDVDYLLVGGVVLVLTAVGVAVSLARMWPAMRPIKRWIGGARGPEQTVEAWKATVGLPLRMVRGHLGSPIFVVAVPAVIAAVIILETSWLAFFPLFAGALVVLGYSAILHYLLLEAGLRPVLADISSELPARYRVGHTGLPLRTRLLAVIPMINIITGFIVAAITADEEGAAALGIDVLIAVAVATTIALGLTILLSRSILLPVADLHRATHAVADGRFDEVEVPVTTGDELGELAGSFNTMVEGLRERERIRDAFGTYLDRDVAEYILSEGFNEEGEDADVSVLFCDVRDFTALSSDSSPKEVVATLNRLYEVIVPVIAEHGGHVDKFEGDGLIAVFGAPEPYPNHADRAVRAACEIATRVNSEGEAGELRVGCGVNSGHVIAGSVGAAGRLDFSVIGSAVNIAARVEQATKKLDKAVLITAATKERLGAGIETGSCGTVELRGLDEPLELFEPVIGEGEPQAEPSPAGARS